MVQQADRLHQHRFVASGCGGSCIPFASQFPGLDACIDSKETKMRLDRTLRHIVNNHLPVSTPQIFLGDTRLCDEYTALGLASTLRKLAPALASK